MVCLCGAQGDHSTPSFAALLKLPQSLGAELEHFVERGLKLGE